MFSFMLEERLKKRYFNLVLNKHISKNYMADHLRACFLSALNEAEAQAGMQLSVAEPIRRYAVRTESAPASVQPADKAYFRNNLVGGLVDGAGEGVG